MYQKMNTCRPILGYNFVISYDINWNMLDLAPAVISTASFASSNFTLLQYCCGALHKHKHITLRTGTSCPVLE